MKKARIEFDIVNGRECACIYVIDAIGDKELSVAYPIIDGMVSKEFIGEVNRFVAFGYEFV